MNENILLWLDVESTGLRPWVGDRLLQVAALVTDMDLNLLESDGFEAVVHYGQDEATRMRSAADDYVRTMHANTGLWGAITSPRAQPLEQIDRELLAYLVQFAPEPRQARMAGNSVRLDMNFAEFYLPHTYAHLHYRVLDVSGLAFAAHEWSGVEFMSKRTHHDARSDIRESLAEARRVRARAFTQG